MSQMSQQPGQQQSSQQTTQQRRPRSSQGQPPQNAQPQRPQTGQGQNTQPQRPQTGQGQNAQPQQAGTVQVHQRAPSGLYPTQNILSADVRTASIAALNHCLADAIVLHSQLKAAHWNVKGPSFYQLHELFEDLAETLEGHVDEIAERATALGGEVPMTTRTAAQMATLPEFQTDVVEGQAVLRQIATSLSAFDDVLYKQITNVSEQGDLDTSDLLNEVSRDVSKALWFVEAHLQGGQSTQSPRPPQQGRPQAGQQNYMSM